MSIVEIVIFIVLLFAVPAALLYGIERFETRLRRIAPALFSVVLVGLRPLHILAVLAAIGGCWLSWTNRTEWDLWQLTVPPILLVVIVYVSPLVGILLVNPFAVGELGFNIFRHAFRRRK